MSEVYAFGHREEWVGFEMWSHDRHDGEALIVVLRREGKPWSGPHIDLHLRRGGADNDVIVRGLSIGDLREAVASAEEVLADWRREGAE